LTARAGRHASPPTGCPSGIRHRRDRSAARPCADPARRGVPRRHQRSNGRCHPRARRGLLARREVGRFITPLDNLPYENQIAFTRKSRQGGGEAPSDSAEAADAARVLATLAAYGEAPLRLKAVHEAPPAVPWMSRAGRSTAACRTQPRVAGSLAAMGEDWKPRSTLHNYALTPAIPAAHQPGPERVRSVAPTSVLSCCWRAENNR